MDDRKRMPPPPLPVPAAHNTPSQAVAAEPHQHGTEEIPDSQDSTVAAPSLASMSQPSPKSPAHVDVKEIPDSQDTVMTEASPKEDARSRRPSVEPLDKTEVARDVAQLLKDMKPYPTKPTQVAPRPPTHPFSTQTNPDAIALRAATSLLQTQKARAASDMANLQSIKQAAMADPEGFIQGIASGELREGRWKEGVPAIPRPQDVVRMPAVNWAKYGVVGESLDKLHEEQRERPSLGEPEQLRRRADQPKVLDNMGKSGERAEKAHVAAPYNPLKKPER